MENRSLQNNFLLLRMWLFIHHFLYSQLGFSCYRNTKKTLTSSLLQADLQRTRGNGCLGSAACTGLLAGVEEIKHAVVKTRGVIWIFLNGMFHRFCFWFLHGELFPPPTRTLYATCKFALLAILAPRLEAAFWRGWSCPCPPATTGQPCQG